MDNEDFQEAKKLIEYSLRMKEIDKATLLFYRSILSEKRGSLKNAVAFLTQAKRYCYSEYSLDIVKSRKKFIKSKMPKKKKKDTK